MKYNKEQQIKIAKYAIDNNYEYKETGAKYDVSYQQVAAWVRKYEAELSNEETVSKNTTKASTLDVLNRRDPVLERQLEDVKRRLGLID